MDNILKPLYVFYPKVGQYDIFMVLKKVLGFTKYLYIYKQKTNEQAIT